MSLCIGSHDHGHPVACRSGLTPVQVTLGLLLICSLSLAVLVLGMMTTVVRSLRSCEDHNFTSSMTPPHDLKDRLVGTLLGTALGDALGLPVEGMSPGAIQRRFGRVDRFRFSAGRALSPMTRSRRRSWLNLWYAIPLTWTAALRRFGNHCWVGSAVFLGASDGQLFDPACGLLWASIPAESGQRVTERQCGLQSSGRSSTTNPKQGKRSGVQSPR